MPEKAVVWLLRGFAGLFGVLALLCLFTRQWGGFFGLSVFSLAFGCFAWALRRLICPTEDETRGDSIGLVTLVIFGGAGIVMLIGSVVLFAGAEAGGGVGLGIFGLVFCTGGYLVWRVFSVPKEKREVLVARTERTVSRGDPSSMVTSSTYTMVDARMSSDEIATKQKEWAQRPWTQREDWVAGRIAQEGASLRMLGIFTVVWNVVAGFFAGAFAWGSGGDFPWIVLAFPLIGIALAVVTLRAWIRKRKFGISVLHCRTVPAWLGGRLEGTLRIDGAAARLSGRELSIRLVCLRKATHRQRDLSGHGRDQVSTDRLWERTAAAQAQLGASAVVEVPIDVAVPNDQPPTVMTPEDDRTLWRLHVSCAVRNLSTIVRQRGSEFSVAPPASRSAG